MKNLINKRCVRDAVFLLAFGGLAPLSVVQAQSTTLLGTGASTTGNGTTLYDTPFSPNGSATVSNPVPGGLGTGITTGAPATTTAGVWTLNATGGLGVFAVGINTADTSAQTSLSSNTLQFNAASSGLLSNLGTGTSISESWLASGTFNTPNIALAPNTTYDLSFNVDGHSGLLNTGLGITPTFTVQLLDGSGNPLVSNGNGSLIDLVGLLGSNTGGSGTVNLTFTTGATVAPGAISIDFAGSSVLNSTLLSVGNQNFATVSNLNLTAAPVPEPGGMVLFGLGVLVVLRRHRSGRLPA